MSTNYIKRILLASALLLFSVAEIICQSRQGSATKNVYIKTFNNVSLPNNIGAKRLGNNTYITSLMNASGIVSGTDFYCCPIWNDNAENYTMDNSIILYDVPDLNALLLHYGIMDNVCTIDSIAGNPIIYILSLKGISYSQIEDLCKNVAKSQYCKIAEPNYITFSKQENIINPYNNPLYLSQWGLNNSSSNGGVDINAPEAWGMTTGANIKVAVIDCGFELQHPDLASNIYSSYDCTNGLDGATNGAYLYNSDSHGTQCAGVISAVNNNIGVIGVAPDSKLILLRRRLTILSWDPIGMYYDTMTITQDSWNIQAIRLAYQLGADVINNSWSYNTSSNITVLDAVLEEAFTQGRNGKGCVVVCSTGNNSCNYINYPSNSPYTISVGAINRYGFRPNWSNCGNGLNIVAPGEFIKTTQIIPKGSYDDVSGTSVAAAMVSGVAALMLSANPSLTNLEVMEIINTTAYKLPEYDFNIQAQNGGWNNQVGYGLVDAYAAVQKAADLNIEGPQYLGDSAWYYVRNVPQGATITWNISNKYPLLNRYVLASEQGRDSMYIAFRYALDPHPSIPPGIINSIGDNDDPNLFPIVMPQLGYLSVTLTQGNSSYTIKKTIREPESNNPSSMPRLHLATQTEDAVINVHMPESLNKSLAKNAYSLELWHSIYGRMWTQAVHNFNEQIPVANLLQGVYVLVLKENENIIAQTKVLVK